MEVALATQEQTSLQLAPRAGTSKTCDKSATEAAAKSGLSTMCDAIALENPAKYKQEGKAFSIGCNKYIPGAPAGSSGAFLDDGETGDPPG